MALKASEGLKKFIREHEGFRSEPYKDVTGKTTIGIGDTEGDMSRPITEEEANARFENRLIQAEIEVSKEIKRPNMTQGEFDTLVDMNFNVGMTKLREQGFVDTINKGSEEEILAAIGKYTKARDEQTGQMRDYDNLVKRAQGRSNMWKMGKDVPTVPVTSGTVEEPGMLDRAASAIKDLFTPDSVDSDLDMAIAATDSPDMEIDNAIAAVNESNTNTISDMVRRSAGIDIASASSFDEDAVSAQTVRNLSERTGLPEKEVETLLVDRKAGDVEVEARKQIIAQYFPEVSEWAQEPNNYILMRDHGAWATQVGASAKNLNKGYIDELKVAAKANVFMFEQAAIHAAMTIGKMTKQEGISALRKIDQERSLNQYGKNAEAVQKIGATGEALGPAFETLFKNVGDLFESDFQSIVPLMRQQYDGTTESLDKILNFFSSVLTSPQAASLVAAESIGSFVPSVGGAVAGGAVGFLSPVPGGTAAGALLGLKGGSFIGSGILSYGEYLQDQLQEFKNPQTGEIDYELAYSDPNRVTKWRKQAATFGVVIGGFDAVTTPLIGKFLTRPVVQGGVKTGAKEVAKGLAKEVTVQGVSEGAGEFTARTAADIVGDELSLKGIAKNAGQATVEGVFGGITGGILAPVGTGVRIVSESVKHKMSKTLDKVKQANQANEGFNALQELRQKRSSSPAAQTNPQQTSQLIDELVLPPLPNEDEFSTAPENIDAGLTTEVNRMELEADSDSVTISPSEWEAYHMDKGLDSVEAISAFGQKALDSYISGRATDTSFSVSISDWLRYTENNPEIDVIARVNGAEFNAIEGASTYDEIKQNPFVLFEEDGLPPLPDEEPPMIPVSSEAEDTIPQGPYTGDAVLRPIELTNAYRDDSEKSLYDGIRRRIKATAKDLNLESPKAIDIVADLQFRHLRSRANLLGQSLSELGKRFKVGQAKDVSFFEGGSTASKDGPYRVAFTKNATAKSLIHELGHSWLFEMSEDWSFISQIPVAQMTPQQLDYFTAMTSAAELLGLRDMGELIELEQNKAQEKRFVLVHETFANTAERYFLDGEFEGSRVQYLLETFRKYINKMGDVIRSISRMYPTLKMSPKVNQIFDALLDANDKYDEEVIPMFSEPMFDPAQLGPKGVDYVNTVRDARSQAQGAFYAKAFNKSLRNRDKEIDFALNVMYDQATEEVDSMPSMILANQFDAAYKDYKKSDDDLSDPRISFNSFSQMFANGDEALADQLRSEIPMQFVAPKKKGGVDASVVLMQLGISDPDRFFGLMKDAAKREEIIQTRVDELIKEKFPVLKTDQEIHRIAQDAVQNRGKEKLILDELEILADQYLTTLRKTTEKAILPPALVNAKSRDSIKREAFGIVGNQNAIKFGPNKFLRDSIKSGRKAARLFGKGNILEAFDEKRIEAVQFFAFLGARDAQTKLARTRARIKQFGKYNKSDAMIKKYDVDVMTYGRQLIQVVGSGSSEIAEFSTEGFTSESAIPENHIDGLNEKLKDFFLDAGGRLGKDISVNSMLQFGEILDNIVFIAKKAKEVEIAGEIFELNMISGGVNREIMNSSAWTFKAPLNLPFELNFGAEEFFATYLRDIINVRTTFGSMFKDNLEFANSWVGKILRNIDVAEASKNVFIDSWRDKIQAAFIKASKKDKGLQAILGPIISRVPFISSVYKDLKPIVSKELEFTFSNQGEEMMAILHMGSLSGAEQLILGNEWGTRSIETGILDESKFWAHFDKRVAEGAITKEIMDALQVVWDAYREIFPIAKETMRKTDDKNIGFVEGRIVRTPWGDYRGGYVPIKPIKDLNAQSDTQSLLNPDSIQYQSTDLFPHMNTGFAESRQKKYYQVDLDVTKVLGNLSSVANVAFLRDPLLTFGKVMSGPDVMNAMDEKRPGAMESQIPAWFNRVKVQAYSEPTGVRSANILARELRRNTGIRLYFGNIATVSKQFLGWLPAAPIVGHGNLLNAIKKVALAPMDSKQFVINKSDVMKARLHGGAKQMVQSFEQLDLNHDWITWTREKAMNATYFGIQMMQNAVDVPLWIAGYSKALNQGLSDSSAIAFADDAVKRSQSSGNVASMSNFQSGNDFWKIFTMVSSVETAMANLMYEEALRDRGSFERAKAIVILGLYAAALPALTAALVSSMINPDDVEDEEKFMDALALEMGANAVGNLIPVLARPVVSAIQYGSAGVSPAFDVGRDLVRSVEGVKNSNKGVDMSTAEIVALLNNFTLATGIPLSIIGKGLRLSEKDLTPQEKRVNKRQRRRQLRRARRDE